MALQHKKMVWLSLSITLGNVQGLNISSFFLKKRYYYHRLIIFVNKFWFYFSLDAYKTFFPVFVVASRLSQQCEAPTDMYGRYICTKCGSTYKKKSDLTRHLNLECGKEPKYQCSYCERKFKRKSNCKAHMLCLHSARWLQFFFL